MELINRLNSLKWNLLRAIEVLLIDVSEIFCVIILPILLFLLSKPRDSLIILITLKVFNII